MNFIKYINRQNNDERSSSYMDILVSRTLYMSCQAGPGIEPGPSALKASALPIEQRGRQIELRITQKSHYGILISIVVLGWYCQDS